MRTNNTLSVGTNQSFSSDSSSKTKPVYTREQLIEKDRLNKERYRLAMASQAATQAPESRDASIPLGRKEAIALEKKWGKLAPKAKAILNHLDGRSEKWSCNPYNQQWIADSVGCTLRWVRECIRRLSKQGFLAILRINRGKPYKTKSGWFTYPNIYIVTPFWRWAESTKLYSIIVAQADKIQREFLQLSNMIKKYIKREDGYTNKNEATTKTLASFIRNKVDLRC